MLADKNFNKKELKNENDFTYVNFVCEAVNVISSDVVESETDNDPISKVVKSSVKKGWPKDVDDQYIVYKRKMNELAIENGCLMWGHKMIIPKSLQAELLKELYSSHIGIVRMKSIAQSYIWWPGIDNQIENIVKKCELCLTYAKNPKKSALHVWEYPDHPNERLHADFLGPVKSKIYMIIVDAYSKWVEV